MAYPHMPVQGPQEIRPNLPRDVILVGKCKYEIKRTKKKQQKQKRNNKSKSETLKSRNGKARSDEIFVVMICSKKIK